VCVCECKALLHGSYLVHIRLAGTIWTECSIECVPLLFFGVCVRLFRIAPACCRYYSWVQRERRSAILSMQGSLFFLLVCVCFAWHLLVADIVCGYNEGRWRPLSAQLIITNLVCHGYMCMCACVYKYLHAYVCIYIYVRGYMRMYACVYEYANAYIYIYICAWIYVYVCLCTRV